MRQVAMLTRIAIRLCKGKAGDEACENTCAIVACSDEADEFLTLLPPERFAADSFAVGCFLFRSEMRSKAHFRLRIFLRRRGQPMRPERSSAASASEPSLSP